MLTNAGFEQQGGSLAGWSVFAHQPVGEANVQVSTDTKLEGNASLKLQGFPGVHDGFCGVTQSIEVTPGDTVTTSLNSLVRPDESIAGTRNLAVAKIEFYSEFGAPFESDKMLDFRELYFANGWTPEGEWVPHTLSATAPDDAVEARLAIVFKQIEPTSGTVHIDQVTLVTDNRETVATPSERAQPQRADNPDAKVPSRWKNIVIALAIVACLFVLFRVLPQFSERKKPTNSD